MSVFNSLTQGEYVSPRGLKNLRTYKYSGVDHCITTKVLNGYWNWLVDKVIPPTIAPNVLTLCGGLCILLAYIFCVISNPLIVDNTVHPFILCIAAFLIFAYQTLDAIDGKQARKTGSSSPLGELFDHGIDAIVMGLMCPVAACAIGAPLHFILICTLSSLVSFYATHWEHYFSGIMEFGAFGPCEMHYVVIAAILVMAASGKPITQWTLPWGISTDTMIYVFFAAILAASLGVTFTSISNVLKSTKNDGKSKESSENSEYVFNNDDNFKYKTAHSSALRGFIPCLVFVFLSSLWSLIEYDTLVAIPHVFIITFTFVFAYIAQRLVVQRVCGEPLVLMYPIFVPYFLCSVNGLLGVVNSKVMAYLMMFVSIAQEILFAVKFIRQLSAYLHIKPFVVSKMYFDDDSDDEDDDNSDVDDNEIGNENEGDVNNDGDDDSNDIIRDD